MDPHDTSFVIVLPHEQVADAIRACITAGGEGLLEHALLCMRGMPADLMGAVLQMAPAMHVESDKGLDRLVTVLKAAGVPSAQSPGYMTAWQDGQAILVLRGLLPQQQEAIHQALATFTVAATPAAAAPFATFPLPSGWRGHSAKPPDPRDRALDFGPAAVGSDDPLSGDTESLDPVAANIRADPGTRDLGLPGPEDEVSGGGPQEGPPAASPPAPVQRYADVQAPGVVQAEQPFKVTVGLKVQAPPDAPQPEAFSVLPTLDAAGAATGAPPILVIINAPAFDVIGSTRGTLQVPADRDSEPITFELRSQPGSKGNQQVSVTFVQGTDILGRVLATIRVGVGVAPTQTLRMDVDGSPPATPIAAPDVILYVDRMMKDGQDHLQFRYQWPQNDQLDITDAGTIAIHNVQEWAQQQYADLSSRARYVPPPGVPTDLTVPGPVRSKVQELDKIGFGLYERLFPAALKTAYAQFAPAANTLLIYSTEPWIPWEIIKPFGAGLAPRDSDFLCARFQMARWLTSEETKRIPRAVAVSAICPVVPSVGLAAAQAESTYINNLSQSWPPLTVYSPIPATAEDVLGAMSAGQVNLFHFATHGNFDPATPGKAALQIGQSQLTPDDVTGPDFRNGLGKSAPLVFVNACHSGREALALSGVGGWVEKLLRYGCSGFVGTNWEVQDSLA
ncbi:MAG TPA: CHAT domain-containing protein, partial [Chloroflexia bacterium]|nr:CHAT domain-containing protein [Chloroflexia bacterium]